MKISELLAKLDGNEATKALATELRGDLGAVLELDTKALAAAVARADTAETQVKELSASVRDLDAKAKGADDLRKKVEGFEAEKREGIIGAAFAKAAKEHGVPEAAHATARKLFDFSKVQVNEKGEVSGLTKESFEALKKEHPILAAETGSAGKDATAAAATQTIPALPPAGSGNAAAAQIPKVEGPVGLFMQANRS